MDNENNRPTLEAVAVGVKAGVAGKLGNVWWFLVLRGVLAVLLGVFALFWPDQNLRLLLLAVGVYCLADGATTLVGALRHSTLHEQFAQAILVLAIGVVLVFWPGATLRTLLITLGAAVFFVGFGQITTARQLPVDDPTRETTRRIGLGMAAVGFVLAFWPGSGVAVISWVIGIAALLIGALLLFLGTRFKRLQHRVDAARIQ
ncbi:HdeD family acid-resistance protein [Haliea sp. E17]|uniref:HdeD family acid-resistance protein n=1 Tax=Haliea sp. E17 TaxID=3401576 RepID=UPI003AAC563E